MFTLEYRKVLSRGWMRDYTEVKSVIYTVLPARSIPRYQGSRRRVPGQGRGVLQPCRQRTYRQKIGSGELNHGNRH